MLGGCAGLGLLFKETLLQELLPEAGLSEAFCLALWTSLGTPSDPAGMTSESSFCFASEHPKSPLSLLRSMFIMRFSFLALRCLKARCVTGFCLSTKPFQVAAVSSFCSLGFLGGVFLVWTKSWVVCVCWSPSSNPCCSARLEAGLRRLSLSPRFLFVAEELTTLPAMESECSASVRPV